VAATEMTHIPPFTSLVAPVWWSEMHFPTHTLKPGDDPLGLGHWCWVLLCSQNSHNIWVVSMYHPCKVDRALSTYQQHLCTLGQLKRDICPKQAILDDLAKENTLWQEAGKMVIIAADFNDDICSDFLRRFLSTLVFLMCAPLCMELHFWQLTTAVPCPLMAFLRLPHSSQCAVLVTWLLTREF